MANEQRPTDAWTDADLTPFEIADTERPPPVPETEAERVAHNASFGWGPEADVDEDGADCRNYADARPCGPIPSAPSEQSRRAAFDTLLAAATRVADLHDQGEMAPSLLDELANAVDAIVDPDGDGRADFGAETCCTALPSDSAARKRVPLCTGVYDYFPDALYAIVDPFYADMLDVLPDSDLVSGFLSYLAIRGQEPTASTIVSWYALCILQQELTGSFRKDRPQTESQLFDSFAESLAAVAEVSWYGNEKHNPGEPLHHARGKSADHADCALRHLVERGGFDGPLRHSACLVWRSLAMDQLECEKRGAPLARGARLPTPDTGDAP